MGIFMTEMGTFNDTETQAIYIKKIRSGRQKEDEYSD